MKKQTLLISIVVGIIIISGIIYFLTNDNNASNDKLITDNIISDIEEDSVEEIMYTNTDGNNSAEKESTCSLPITDVPGLAMNYGVPDGWMVEKENGTLAIMEDDSNLVTAFIYTAKLEKNLSATEFLNNFGDIFKATIENAGGSFTLGAITESDSQSTAQVNATVIEDDLQGVFKTQKETGFITFTAYWAPVNQLAAKEPTLKSVLDCYSRTTALSDADLAAASQAAETQNTINSASSNPWGSLVDQTDGSFSFQAPLNWTSNVSSATESTSLALDAPNSDASVAFLYNLGRYGVVSTQEFAENTMLITWGINATLTDYQSIDGADLWEFDGNFSGKSVHGAVAVRVEPYQTFFAHYLSIQITNSDLWETYAPTLNAIQSSIRLTDAGQQLSSLPAMPNYDTKALFGEDAGSSVTSGNKYKQEVEDKSAQNWSDAMRGYQTMESPSTGDTYDVPLNSYNPTGPNGGGYYRQLPGGGLEQLSPAS